MYCEDGERQSCRKLGKDFFCDRKGMKHDCPANWTCKRGRRYIWIGTAPYCRGRARLCYKNKLIYIRRSRVGGDGKRCKTGWKVLCRGR
jgi:hypothetical protein